MNCVPLSDNITLVNTIHENINIKASVIASEDIILNDNASGHLVDMSTTIRIYLSPQMEMIFHGPTMSAATFSNKYDGMSDAGLVPLALCLLVSLTDTARRAGRIFFCWMYIQPRKTA